MPEETTTEAPVAPDAVAPETAPAPPTPQEAATLVLAQLTKMEKATNAASDACNAIDHEYASQLRSLCAGVLNQIAREVAALVRMKGGA